MKNIHKNHNILVNKIMSFGNCFHPKVPEQLRIARSVTGDDPKLDKPTQVRRKATWQGFYESDNSKGCQQFTRLDLVAIAKEYADSKRH